MKIFSVQNRNFEVDFSLQTEINEIVMAKVIDSYVMKNIPKPLEGAFQLRRGKVIGFGLPTNESA